MDQKFKPHHVVDKISKPYPLPCSIYRMWPSALFYRHDIYLLWQDCNMAIAKDYMTDKALWPLYGNRISAEDGNS